MADSYGMPTFGYTQLPGLLVFDPARECKAAGVLRRWSMVEKFSTGLRLVRRHLLWALIVAYYIEKLVNGVINYHAPAVPKSLRA
jgi:hypothetical protein